MPRIVRNPAVAWLAVVFTWLPSLAMAGPGGGGDAAKTWRVFVMRPVRGPGVAESSVDRVTAYAETLLSINDRFELVPAEQLGTSKGALEPAAAALPEAPPDPRLDKADKLMWKARDLRSAGAYMKAATLLKGVIRAYAQRFMNMKDFTQMTEALYEAAITFHAARLRGPAKSMLKVLLTLRPDTALDPKTTPADLLALAAEVKAKVDRAPGGKLKVSTVPEGARVYVDGIDMGPSPVEVDMAVAGPHFLVARLPGFAPAGKRSRVRAKGRTTKARLRLRKLKVQRAAPARLKKVRLERVAAIVEKGRFGARALKTLRAFALQAKLDFIVISHVGRLNDKLVYAPFVYATRERVLVQAEASLVARDLSDLQIALLPTPERLLAVLDSVPKDRAVRGTPEPWKTRAPPPAPVVKPPPDRPPVIVTPPPVEPVKPPPVAVQPPPVAPPPGGEDEGGSVFGKWWFWTAAGALIAGGVTAAVVLSGAKGDSPSTYRASVVWQ